MRKLAALLFCAVCACDRAPLSSDSSGRAPLAGGPNHSVVRFNTVQFSVPDTIVADSATQRCDIPLTYASTHWANGQFDSSSVRVWETEMPLNEATMMDFMGPIAAGLEHTGVLLDASLPPHVATAPYTGNFILYHSLPGTMDGGAYLTWTCVRFRTGRTPPSGVPLEPPA